MNWERGTRVLVVAPHCDDESLGAGGTIARMVAEGADVTLLVATGEGAVAHPTIPAHVFRVVQAEARAAATTLGISDIVFADLPAVGAPDVPTWVRNSVIGGIIEERSPEIILCPFAFDLHGDHRAIFQAISVACRPNTSHGRRVRAILSYEVMSETHWNAPYLEAGFLPNLYSDISQTLEVKLQAVSQYASQLQEPPAARSLYAVEALARFRGAQFGVAAAEAFVVIRAAI